MNEALKKLCWNCDGSVAMYEIRCPYCAVSLTDSEEEEAPDQSYQSYLASNSQVDDTQASFEEVPEPIYSYYQEKEEGLQEKEENFEGVQEDEPIEAENSSSLLPLILLLPGSSLLILGVALFLFSSEGHLTFQFDTKYWFLYLFAAVPLLYFGWKSLSSRDDSTDKFFDESQYS